MKTWIAVIVVFVVGISAFWIVSQNAKPTTVNIKLKTDPFPLTLGETTVFFEVTDSDGAPVDAEVSLQADMMMEGMLPINIQKLTYKNGAYQVPISWPMAGQWMINASAKVAGIQEPVKESFAVYVYSTVVDNPGGPAEYRTVRQDQNVNTDPEHQYYIVIPQGTRILMQLGQAPDVMPTELHMKINGMNTLVIQNNDIVDHTIGPYMVRAGETMRQTFTQPAIYQGKCSVNVRATVKIIVDA